MTYSNEDLCQIHAKYQAPDLMQKSMQNAGVLMFVQILSKKMTFTLNFMVARIVSKEVYGYANIQLQLFNSTILWFAKEAVRKAAQRKASTLQDA